MKQEKGIRLVQGKGMKDRRVFGRFEARFPVKFKEVSKRGKDDGLCRDVSGLGINMITTRRLPLNSLIELWIDVPEAKAPVHFKGRVIWSNEDEEGVWRMGVSFEEISLASLWRVFKEYTE